MEPHELDPINSINLHYNPIIATSHPILEAFAYSIYKPFTKMTIVHMGKFSVSFSTFLDVPEKIFG